MPRARLDVTRPFLRTEALAAGLSDALLRGPNFRQLFRRIHIGAAVPVDTWTRARGAMLLAPPRAAIARHTAAELWGAKPPATWLTHVTTFWPPAAERAASPEKSRVLARTGEPTAHPWGRMDVDGIDSRVSIDDTRVVYHKGLPVTDPVRTFLDLAEDLDLVELVVVGDSLVRATSTSPQDLVKAAATPGRYRRRARRAAALVRERVDSAYESRSRMLLVLAGIVEPEVDIRFTDEDGNLLRRLDMGYRDLRIGIEYDGRQHVEVVEEWEQDIDRREEFDDLEWRLVKIIAKDLWVQPERTLQRVQRAFASRGVRIQPTSTEWKRYFGPAHTRTA